MVKIYPVPIKKHLIPFLKTLYANDFKNGVFHVKKRMITSRSDNWHFRKYFEETSTGDEFGKLIVQSSFSRDIAIFAFVCYVNKLFKDRLHGFIEAREGICSHSEAIQLFFSKYNISAYDYSIASAYKSWQRSPEYQVIKQQRKNEQYKISFRR